MDRGAWRATVHGVAKSQTRLSQHARIYYYFWLCCLCCSAGFSLVVASGGSSVASVCGLLNTVASLVADHRLRGTLALVVEAPGL